jgi:hypothetical protein
LEVGIVRKCPAENPFLDVVQDKVDHANITGVPLMDEDAEKALMIARYLARMAVDHPI